MGAFSTATRMQFENALTLFLTIDIYGYIDILIIDILSIYIIVIRIYSYNAIVQWCRVLFTKKISKRREALVQEGRISVKSHI